MRKYFNLDEAEIDNILMINLFPKRRERLNFSDRNVFEDVLMPEINKRDAQLDFIKNLMALHERKRGPSKSKKNEGPDYQFYHDFLFSSPKYLKLAVLITIDSIEE